MKIICPVCGKSSDREIGHVNRAVAIGSPVYCGRVCSGIGRRKGKTKAQLVEAKRIYDEEYRAKNQERLKAQKKIHFKRTYDPVAAAIHRQTRMPYHVEYCRTPEYKRKKKEYDKQYRAKMNYGDFWEAFLVTQDLTAEILDNASRYDIGIENGTLNKVKNRRLPHE